MSGVWQQVFALDARYNAQRAPHQHNFRTMYIRRRNQLLKNTEWLQNQEKADLGQTYLRLRALLLQKRYGADTRSICSTSRMSEHSVITGSSPGGVVPTREASASRALVGGGSLAQNYAFGGVAHIFDQHTKPVVCLKFANNDRDLLLCASHDGLVSICSVSPPRVLHMLHGHVGSVTCCDWSAGNDVIVSGGTDGTLRLWASNTGACLRCVADPSRAQVTACVFQPANNNILIVGNSDGAVSLVNISAGIFPKGASCKIGGTVLSMCCDATLHLIWAGNDRGSVTSLSMAGGRLVKHRRVVVSPGRPITCLSYRQWASREARDPTLLINCAADAVFIFRVIDNEGGVVLRHKLPIKHRTHHISSTFCPIMSFREGACIVTGSEDACVYVLDVEKPADKAVINKLQGHSFPVLGTTFNYDESLLATSDTSGLIILWRRDPVTS